MRGVTLQQSRALSDLVGAPFLVGARGPKAYDCLGLTLEGLRILRPDLIVLDPWHNYETRWKGGWRPKQGEIFPEGWELIEDPLRAQAGDVLGVGNQALGTLEHLDLKIWGSLVLRTRPSSGATLIDMRHVRRSLVLIMRPPR